MREPPLPFTAEEIAKLGRQAFALLDDFCPECGNELDEDEGGPLCELCEALMAAEGK
jgi:hypothetical protein